MNFGRTWAGIDAQWKAKHSGVMPYEDAWPLIRTGSYIEVASEGRA